MRPDGSGTTQLTDGGDDGHPTWSADGNWIAFGRRDSSGASRILLVSITGETQPLGGDWARTGSDPALSPPDSQ
jgi:Tol biopolymer transport system component